MSYSVISIGEKKDIRTYRVTGKDSWQTRDLDLALSDR